MGLALRHADLLRTAFLDCGDVSSGASNNLSFPILSAAARRLPGTLLGSVDGVSRDLSTETRPDASGGRRQLGRIGISPDLSLLRLSLGAPRRFPMAASINHPDGFADGGVWGFLYGGPGQRHG